MNRGFPYELLLASCSPLAFGCYSAGTLKGGHGRGVTIYPHRREKDFRIKIFGPGLIRGASLPRGTGINDFFEVVSVLVIKHRGCMGPVSGFGFGFWQTGHPGRAVAGWVQDGLAQGKWYTLTSLGRVRASRGARGALSEPLALSRCRVRRTGGDRPTMRPQQSSLITWVSKGVMLDAKFNFS